METITIPQSPQSSTIFRKYRVIIYARSRVVLHKDDAADTITHQVDYLKHVCKERDWEIVKIVRESGPTISASAYHIEGQPTLKRVIRRLANGSIDAVLVKEVGTFSRNTLGGNLMLNELASKGVCVHSMLSFHIPSLSTLEFRSDSDPRMFQKMLHEAEKDSMRRVCSARATNFMKTTLGEKWHDADYDSSSDDEASSDASTETPSDDDIFPLHRKRPREMSDTVDTAVRRVSRLPNAPL